MNEAAKSEWRYIGRRKGRALNQTRQEALDKLYPQLAITENLLCRKGTLDPKQLFSSQPQKIIFEIGFGNGERLARHIDRADAHTAFIGAEPFLNGLSAFLCEETINANSPVRLWHDDAMIIADSLKPHSVNQIYILNPDPWHKTRHFKRRIINPDNLDRLARILKPDGDLIVSSDVPPLIDWMVTHTVNHKAFAWTAYTPEDWQKPPPDWLSTHYEGKRAKGAAQMAYLFFKRRAEASI